MLCVDLKDAKGSGVATQLAWRRAHLVVEGVGWEEPPRSSPLWCT